MSEPLTGAPVGEATAAAVSAPRGTARRRMGVRRRRDLAGIALVAPAVLVVTVFFFVPLVLMLWMSLHDWPLLGTPSFAGLENYAEALGDTQFRTAAWFTLKYTAITTPVMFLVGLGLALLVRRRRRGAAVFQSIYFLPVVLGFAAGSFLFLYMSQTGIGPLFDLLRRVGLVERTDNWFVDPSSALLVVVLSVTWKFVGMQMLLLLSGLHSIPVEVEEAARIDGAGRWHTFRYITLPLLRPTLALVLVFSVAGSLLAFDQFFIMTNGGPNNSTITAVYQIYRVSFIQFQLGYGAALSALLLVVLAAVSAAQLLLLRNTDHA